MGPKRRGRPSKKPQVEAPVVAAKGSKISKSAKKAKTFAIKAIQIPVTERDEETVECDACDKEMTFREFRIHNLTDHYNIASTKDDTQKKDHRFYERCLKNMLRLKKVLIFHCPRPNCESKYKSTLGLAYHLEQCGRTREEIQADYILCEHCGKSYSFTTITWHRKTHATKAEPVHAPKAKRASAKKASQKFKKLSEGDDIELIISAEHADDDFNPSGQEDLDDAETSKKRSSTKVPELSPNDGISAYAHKAISSLPRMSPSETWERPSRILTDIFPNISTNQLRPLTKFRDFLPARYQSFQFKTAKRNGDIEPGKRSRTDTTDYHRLRIFESEVTDSERANNVINVGGPVSSMSWHPSGKYLAVAVLNNLDTNPRIHDVDVHPTCIQIYENFYNPDEKFGSGNGLSLKLVFGVRNGFIHCVQWSSYWPEEESPVVGHLAYSCGDGSIEIIYVEKSSFQAPPNVLPHEDAMQLVPIYQKSPEIRLILNSACREESGQCVSFQWHENLKYLAAGYASGFIAVFDVPTESRLLRKSVVMDRKGDCTLEIQPIWSIRAHTSVVSAMTFASCRARYLVSCSHDYYVKMWDLELRREMESKKIGMVLDACWIRGWAHLGVAAEYTNLNYQISFNTTKFFQVGSAKGFANVPDHLNITCLSFHEGMLAHGSELGRVTLTYYDQYLRECDYDRNKRKKNTIDFCCIEIDKDVPRKEIIEDPKLVITIEDYVRPVHHSIPEPTMDNYEDYIVYYQYVRANKISWCPNGKQLATGYHNGLVVVTPTLPDMFSHVFSKH